MSWGLFIGISIFLGLVLEDAADSFIGAMLIGWAHLIGLGIIAAFLVIGTPEVEPLLGSWAGPVMLVAGYLMLVVLAAVVAALGSLIERITRWLS